MHFISPSLAPPLFLVGGKSSIGELRRKYGLPGGRQKKIKTISKKNWQKSVIGLGLRALGKSLGNWKRDDGGWNYYDCAGGHTGKQTKTRDGMAVIGAFGEDHLTGPVSGRKPEVGD